MSIKEDRWREKRGRWWQLYSSHRLCIVFFHASVHGKVHSIQLMSNKLPRRRIRWNVSRTTMENRMTRVKATWSYITAARPSTLPPTFRRLTYQALPPPLSTHVFYGRNFLDPITATPYTSSRILSVQMGLCCCRRLFCCCLRLFCWCSRY